MKQILELPSVAKAARYDNVNVGRIIMYLQNVRRFKAVLRIQIQILIHRIHMFLGLLDPDPDLLVRGMEPAPDPDPSITKQK